MFRRTQPIISQSEKSTPQHKERGASMVEYSLLVALITVAAITGVTKLGEGTKAKFEAAADAVTGAGRAGGPTDSN